MSDSMSLFGFFLATFCVIAILPVFRFFQRVMDLFTFPFNQPNRELDHTIIVEEEPPDFSRYWKYIREEDRL